MKLQAILKQYLEENNISVRELSRRSGLSNSYVTNIINGSNDNPSLEAFGKLARAMNVNSLELFEALDEDQSFNISGIPPEQIKIPLYSEISCGLGMFVSDIPEDYISVPNRIIKKNQTYFANIAHGDSMVGKGIKDGDILVFERTSSLESGQIGSFCVGDKNYCKIFRKLNNGMILLESANEKYDPIVIDVANNEDCFRIIGVLKFKFSIEQ